MYNKSNCHHLIKILINFFGEDKQPDHWQLSAVTFGNNPSGAITLAVLCRTAQVKQQEYSEAAYVIMKTTYVDDIHKSVNDIETAQRLSYW